MLVTISSKTVKEACEITLKNIQLIRDKEDQEMIQKHRRLRWWFFGQAETDEEVDLRLSHTSSFQLSFFYPSISCWGTKEICKQILVACKLSDEVTLDIKIVSKLWWENSSPVTEDDYFG